MRVFVLGAGSSLHAGYPLASELGNSLSAWIKSSSAGRPYRDSVEQVADLYGGLADFEAVLADLMTCKRGSRAAAMGIARPYVVGDLQEAIREYFNRIRTKAAPLYKQLARALRPGDTVITFNYDLAVERAVAKAGLWDIRTGYGFAVEGRQPSPVEVLKLHGSTNWRALLFGGMRGSFVGNHNSLGYRPALYFRPDLKYLGFENFIDPLCAGIKTGQLYS